MRPIAADVARSTVCVSEPSKYDPASVTICSIIVIQVLFTFASL